MTYIIKTSAFLLENECLQEELAEGRTAHAVQ